jgi:hypothetical protein
LNGKAEGAVVLAREVLRFAAIAESDETFGAETVAGRKT